MSDNNIVMAVKDHKLTITVDLNKDLGETKSGKSRAVASSYGTLNVPGSKAKLNLNLYIPVEAQ